MRWKQEEGKRVKLVAFLPARTCFGFVHPDAEFFPELESSRPRTVSNPMHSFCHQLCFLSSCSCSFHNCTVRDCNTRRGPHHANRVLVYIPSPILSICPSCDLCHLLAFFNSPFSQSSVAHHVGPNPPSIASQPGVHLQNSIRIILCC